MTQLVPDSAGYLNWAPNRTPGYPAFLWAWQHIDPMLHYLTYFQGYLFVVSTIFMVLSCLERPKIQIYAGAAILTNVYIWHYTQSVMTDGLYISLFMIFLGCWPRLPGAIVVAIMALIRPVGLSLLPLIGWPVFIILPVVLLIDISAITNFTELDTNHSVKHILWNYYVLWTLPALDDRIPVLMISLKTGAAIALMVWSWLIMISRRGLVQIVAMSINSQLVFVALTVPALPRYSMAVWPAVVLMVALEWERWISSKPQG